MEAADRTDGLKRRLRKVNIADGRDSRQPFFRGSGANHLGDHTKKGWGEGVCWRGTQWDARNAEGRPSLLNLASAHTGHSMPL